MITLIVGNIPFLAERALYKIRRDAPDREETVFFGDELVPGDFLAASGHLTLLGGAPRIIVRHAEKLLKKQQEKLLPLLEELTDDVEVVLLADAIDRRLKFWKQVEKLSKVVKAEPPPKYQRRPWWERLCKHFNVTLDRQAFDRLVEIGADDVSRAISLIETLDLNCGDNRKVSLQQLEELLEGPDAATVFSCLDAVGSKDWKKAFSMLENLWHNGTEPIAVWSLLVRHLRILLKVSELQREKVATSQMASLVGVPPFAVDNYSRQAGKYSLNALQMLWPQMMQTDKALKSSMGDRQLLVESFFLKLRSIA